MQKEAVWRDWEGKEKEGIGWDGGREGRMDGDGSWRGVQNHSLDVCEITLTVRPHKQNKHQEAETCKASDDQIVRLYKSMYGHSATHLKTA